MIDVHHFGLGLAATPVGMWGEQRAALPVRCSTHTHTSHCPYPPTPRTAHTPTHHPTYNLPPNLFPSSPPPPHQPAASHLFLPSPFPACPDSSASARGGMRGCIGGMGYVLLGCLSPPTYNALRALMKLRAASVGLTEAMRHMVGACWLVFEVLFSTCMHACIACLRGCECRLAGAAVARVGVCMKFAKAGLPCFVMHTCPPLLRHSHKPTHPPHLTPLP